MVDIIFDNSLKKDIITKILKKEIDEENRIIDSKTKEYAFTPNNIEVDANNLAVFENGSEIFILDDMVSLLAYSKRK